jgi:hypothetical protein
MVAGEGLTVSVAQGKAKSGPPFIKTMKGWATPEIKIKSKSSRTLRVIHPPDGPRRMLFVDESLHIHRTPAHLLPVHVADQRLVARIFLAHAASLRHPIFFSRMKFRGFLHSSKPKGPPPIRAHVLRACDPPVRIRLPRQPRHSM